MLIENFIGNLLIVVLREKNSLVIMIIARGLEERSQNWQISWKKYVQMWKKKMEGESPLSKYV